MRTIATFWSINTTLPPVERYHLGQLSAALYADDVVRSGGRHFAIICDNDALTDDQYSRISEISAAISSLCSEPVIVRTLTSFRINMQAGDRAAAAAISSEVWKLRDEVRSRKSSIGSRISDALPATIPTPCTFLWRFQKLELLPGNRSQTRRTGGAAGGWGSARGDRYTP